MAGRDMVNKKGFTVVELLVVLAIISIFALVATADIARFYRIYKYYDYAFSVESLVRFARMTAMERSINVGVCVDDDKNLSIRNLGTRRTADACNGTVMRSIRIPQEEGFSFSGSNFSFDPRGFALSSGNVCFTDGNKYKKICVSRFGAIRIEEGHGECGPC